MNLHGVFVRQPVTFLTCFTVLFIALVNVSTINHDKLWFTTAHFTGSS